jgi:hypothetical protein
MMSMSNLSELWPNTVLEPTGGGAGSSASGSTSQPAGGSFEVLISPFPDGARSTAAPVRQTLLIKRADGNIVNIDCAMATSKRDRIRRAALKWNCQI